jgi:two-component system NtrC family sensor kinase
MSLSLRSKTILGIASIEAALLAFLVATVLYYLHDTAEEELIQRANTTASLFAATTKDSVLSYDLASLETVTDEVINNSGVVYARVIGPNQTVFAEAGNKQQLERKFVSDTVLKDATDGTFDRYAEIKEDGVIYGRVEIGIDTKSIEAAIARAKNWSAFIAAIEMLLVALFSFFLGGYLTGQLKTLQEAAREISKGSLNVNVPVKGKDEVAEVATAFNHMIENLKLSQQKRDEYELELTELNQTLEDRVEKRTLELTKLNGELTDVYVKIKTAQSQLLQSEKMASIGQLAAGVAHEINNPVGFIGSNLESLKGYVAIYQKLFSSYKAYVDCSDDELRQKLADEIRHFADSEDIDFVHDDIKTLVQESIDGTSRVRDIVQGLQNFSHADSPNRDLTDINQCIRFTLKVVNNQIKYNCEVHEELQEIPLVLCNTGQLNQILLNLIVNASHAIEDKGLISITTYCDSDFVIIEISDSGKGIPAENIPKLFDPFFTTKPVGEGTGLGLAIVYAIITDHNGLIDVESTEGVGTKFIIKLPVNEPITDDMKIRQVANQR